MQEHRAQYVSKRGKRLNRKYYYNKRYAPKRSVPFIYISLSKKFVCGRDFSRPENLDSEAILRLVAVTH